LSNVCFECSRYYETSLEHRNEELIEYTCRAENINGHIEHKIKVIKSGSLIFTEPLKNQTIQEGVLMNWPCLAQSNGEVFYKWFKNSIIVENALEKWDERGALFQDGMLYLSETLRSDSGFYECHAYTPTKRIQSSAYLNVICKLISVYCLRFGAQSSQSFFGKFFKKLSESQFRPDICIFVNICLNC
jgi:hypothetical protein